jgi:hypothetical protein
MDEILIIETLRQSFEDDNIKRHILDEQWYQLNIDSDIHSTGFCFSASEVLYRLTGGNANWQVRYLHDPTHWSNGTHYFLKRRANNDIVDLTSDQYTGRGIEIPYTIGRGTGLRNISNKARLLARLTGLGELN